MELWEICQDQIGWSSGGEFPFWWVLSLRRWTLEWEGGGIRELSHPILRPRQWSRLCVCGFPGLLRPRVLDKYREPVKGHWRRQTTLSFLQPVAKNGFYIFTWLKKSRLFHDMYGIQTSESMSSSIGTGHGHSFIYCLWLLLYYRNRVE